MVNSLADRQDGLYEVIYIVAYKDTEDVKDNANDKY